MTAPASPIASPARPKRRKGKYLEIGQLIVHGNDHIGYRVTEPTTHCCVAKGFPTELQAATAAKEMDELADWWGIVKTRARGGVPNCMDEIADIAKRFGGRIANGADEGTERLCASVVAQREGA